MHQILPIMLFGNPIKFTLLCSIFLALRSDYSLMMLKLFLHTIIHNVYHVELTATFLLCTKSTTFRALNLSRQKLASLLLHIRFSTHGMSQLTHYLKMLRY